MNPDHFDQALRERTSRRPFRAFEVVLKGGGRILVTHPDVAFGGGVACLPTEEEGLVDFTWDQVNEFREAPQEAAS